MSFLVIVFVRCANVCERMQGRKSIASKASNHCLHCLPNTEVNMLFSSTTISNGSCVGVVTSTGMETEIGAIQEQLETVISFTCQFAKDRTRCQMPFQMPFRKS